MNREVTVNDSSHIKRIGWDYDTQILVVEFHSGSVYRYQFVSQYVFGEFISAESVGKFFTEYIRFNSGFPYEQIGGWPE